MPNGEPGQHSWYSNSLQAGQAEGSNYGGGEISAPIQTGPGAHPAYYTIGAWSFLGEERLGH